jgi:hypothetical protein
MDDRGPTGPRWCHVDFTDLPTLHSTYSVSAATWPEEPDAPPPTWHDGTSSSVASSSLSKDPSVMPWLRPIQTDVSWSSGESPRFSLLRTPRCVVVRSSSGRICLMPQPWPAALWFSLRSMVQLL